MPREDIEQKREKEKQTVSYMVKLYCKGKGKLKKLAFLVVCRSS